MDNCERMVPESEYELLKKANEGLMSQVDSLKRNLEFEKDWSRGLNTQRRKREDAVEKFIRDIEDFTSDSMALEDIVSAFKEKYFGIYNMVFKEMNK